MKLREYQIEAVERMVDARRFMLFDDRGIGKTVIALEAVKRLGVKSVLVITRKVSIAVWMNEIRNYLGEFAIAFTGAEWQRKKAFIEYIDEDKRFLVTNYEQVYGVLNERQRWDAIIIDEAHKIRNRKTQVFKGIKRLRSDILFLLTGTPIVSGPDNLWSLLHLIDPKQFSSYWKFCNDWLLLEQGEYGVTVHGVKDAAKFRHMLRSFMLRRTQVELMDLGILPEKSRNLYPVELTPLQSKLYKSMYQHLLMEHNGHITMAPNEMTSALRLRQMLITPALLGYANESGAFEVLNELVSDDFDMGDSVVVFTPFTQAIPYIERALPHETQVRGVIKGGMSVKNIDAVLRMFNEIEHRRKALIVSLMMAESFSAIGGNHAYFVGYDWTPAVNLQAEDRLARIGQRKMVQCTYLGYQGTIDERVMDVLDEKTTFAQVIESDNYRRLKAEHNAVKDEATG